MEGLKLSEFWNYNETLFICECPECGGQINKTLPQTEDIVSCSKCDKEFIVV
jgi:hypothetical protein